MTPAPEPLQNLALCALTRTVGGVSPAPRIVSAVLALAVLGVPSLASAAPAAPVEDPQAALVRAQVVGALFADRRAADVALDLVVEEYGFVFSEATVEDTPSEPTMDVAAPAAPEAAVEAPMEFQMATPVETEESPVVEVPAGKASTTHVRGVTPSSPAYQLPSALPYTSSVEGGAKSAALTQLEVYGNGQIPAEALMPIGQGSHRLWGPAAAAFQAMSAAADADGIQISVTDSYRSYAVQVDLVARKGLYSQGGLAATPGTSNHGWGLAIDVDTSGGVYEWLRLNAGTYGFVEDTPREPWHWGYYG